MAGGARESFPKCGALAARRRHGRGLNTGPGREPMHLAAAAVNNYVKAAPRQPVSRPRCHAPPPRPQARRLGTRPCGASPRDTSLRRDALPSRVMGPLIHAALHAIRVGPEQGEPGASPPSALRWPKNPSRISEVPPTRRLERVLARRSSSSSSACRRRRRRCRRRRIKNATRRTTAARRARALAARLPLAIWTAHAGSSPPPAAQGSGTCRERGLGHGGGEVTRC